MCQTKLFDLEEPVGYIKKEKVYTEDDFVNLEAHCVQTQTQFIKYIEEAEA